MTTLEILIAPGVGWLAVWALAVGVWAWRDSRFGGRK